MIDKDELFHKIRDTYPVGAVFGQGRKKRLTEG